MNDMPPAERATLSRVILVSDLDASGTDYAIEASAVERRDIAARLDIPALNRLSADFRLTPTRGGVDIRFTLNAETERICVVSLEPMREVIHEMVTLELRRAYDPDEDIDDDEVIRERLDGDEIDIGELLVQFLSLSLDPYPRKPRAEPLLEQYCDATSTSPFASLKRLVDRDQ